MAPNTTNDHFKDSDAHVETSPNDRYIRYNAVLGKGAYKTVYKAFDTEEALEVAWNKLHVDRLSEHDLEKVSNEVSLLRKVDHKNIIHFYDTWRSEEPNGTQTINFITEQMMSGTLKEYLKKAKAIKLKVIRRWCRNILEAIQYLHSREPPIMHRDLKCDNIFINGHVGEVKIGDLGLSGVKDRDKAESVIGTPEFMAPELYEESYTEKVDIYAFGMCLLEMVTMEYPYSECTNMAQIFKKVFQGEKPKAFSMLEDGPLKEVVAACLQREANRPSAARLLEHPLFKEWYQDEGKYSNLSIVKGPHTAVETAISTTRRASPMPIGTEFIDWSEPLNRNVFVSMVELDPADNDNQVSVVAKDQQGGGAFPIGVEIPISIEVPFGGDAIKRVEFSFNPFTDNSHHIAQEMVAEFDLGEDKLPVIQFEIERHVHTAKREREEASRNATPQIVSHQGEPTSSPPPPQATDAPSSILTLSQHTSLPLSSPNAQPLSSAQSVTTAPTTQSLPPVEQSAVPLSDAAVNPPEALIPTIDVTVSAVQRPPPLPRKIDGNIQPTNDLSSIVENQYVAPAGQVIQDVGGGVHPSVHLNDPNISQHVSQTFDQAQTTETHNGFVPQYNHSTPAIPHEVASEILPPSLHEAHNIPKEEVSETQPIVQQSIAPPSPEAPPSVQTSEFPSSQSQLSSTQLPSLATPEAPTDQIVQKPVPTPPNSINSVDTSAATEKPPDPPSQAPVATSRKLDIHSNILNSEPSTAPDATGEDSNPTQSAIVSNSEIVQIVPHMIVGSNVGNLPPPDVAPVVPHNPDNVQTVNAVNESAPSNTPNFAHQSVPALPQVHTIQPEQIQPSPTGHGNFPSNNGHIATPDGHPSIQPIVSSQVSHSISDGQLRNSHSSHIGATELPPRPPSTPITPDSAQIVELSQRLKKSASEAQAVGTSIDNDARSLQKVGLVAVDQVGMGADVSQGHSRPSSISIPRIVVVHNESASTVSQDSQPIPQATANDISSSPSDGVVDPSQSLKPSLSREHIERNMTNRLSPQNAESQSYNLLHVPDTKITGRMSPEHRTPTSGQMKGTSWRSVQSADTNASKDKKNSDSSDTRSEKQQLSICLKLMDLCARGRYEDVKNVLMNGASTTFQDYDKRTPLHVAAMEGHYPVCQLLIENGAQISARNRWGNTALSDAREHKHFEVVDLLKQYGAEDIDGDVEKLEFLHYCAVGDVEAVRNLINGGARASLCDYEQRTPLHLACSEGHIEVVELLLINGASYDAVDRKKRTPIQDAVTNGRRDILKLLARHGAKMPPHLYVTNEELLNRLAMDLIVYSANGDISGVQDCLDDGADPNFTDYDLRTPLHLACVEGHEEIVIMLLSAGAKLDMRDRWGISPLEEARLAKREAMVQRIEEFDVKRRKEGQASEGMKISDMIDANGHGGRSTEMLGMHFPGSMSLNSIHFSADDFAAKPITVSNSMEQVSTPMPSLPNTPFEVSSNDASQQVERSIAQEMGKKSEGDFAEAWTVEGEVGIYGARQLNDRIEGGEAAARNSVDGSFGISMPGMARRAEQMGMSGEDVRNSDPVAYSSSMMSLSSITNGLDGRLGSQGRIGPLSGSPVQIVNGRRQEVTVEMRQLVECLVDAAVREEN